MLGKEGGEGDLVFMEGCSVYTLGTAVFSWLPSWSVLKPTPLTGIQAVSHAKKCECSGGVHSEAEKVCPSSDAAPLLPAPIKINLG